MKMFTAKERKNLEYVLSKAPSEDDAMFIEEVHGLLFGLAITPDEIPPEEWISLLFSQQPAQYDHEEDTAVCLGYVMEIFRRMKQDWKINKLKFPFNYKKISDDDFPAIHSWVCGFFVAICLRPAVWGLDKEYSEKDIENLTEEALELMDAVNSIIAIAMPEAMDEVLQGVNDESMDGESLLASFFGNLPESVEVMKNHAAGIRKNDEQMH